MEKNVLVFVDFFSKVLDVTMALSKIASEHDYVRPELVADASVFEVQRGRHAVVEAVQSDAGRATALFTPNDCYLNAAHGRCWLITGPNMGGKSTFLRQNALLAIMAQIGSFVPADAARIGIVDRIFCRIGAAGKRVEREKKLF